MSKNNFSSDPDICKTKLINFTRRRRERLFAIHRTSHTTSGEQKVTLVVLRSMSSDNHTQPQDASDATRNCK